MIFLPTSLINSPFPKQQPENHFSDSLHAYIVLGVAVS